jgi:hypothetical protein
MRQIRIFVVGLLMLWLPVQAVAAVAMPFCPHGGAADAGASSHEHHHPDSSTPASEHHGSRHSNPDTAAGGLQQCNNCGACNLACAPAVPASEVALSEVRVTVQPVFLATSFELFIPDQPQPPPDFLL